MPPLIAVTTSVAMDERGRERAQVNASYIRAVEQAGGVTVLVPPQLSFESLRALIGAVDGLLLTGGGDINPARYGEERHPATTGLSDDRDTVEEAVVNLALDRQLPVLAVCRGMQMLNVALGGTLVQDIPSMVGGAVTHASPEGVHAVRITPGSHLASIIGAEAAEVNSRHHQALKALANGVQAVAWAPDGVIEGVEMPGRWVVGVQWHPEDMTDSAEHARRLFRGLVDAAQGRGL